MPAEIRITNARLKSLLVSLISFAIAAAASPLLFVGSLKSVLSGAFIVLFCLVFAVLLLYRAADSRTKLVLNADGIRLVQAASTPVAKTFSTRGSRLTALFSLIRFLPPCT